MSSLLFFFIFVLFAPLIPRVYMYEEGRHFSVSLNYSREISLLSGDASPTNTKERRVKIIFIQKIPGNRFITIIYHRSLLSCYIYRVISSLPGLVHPCNRVLCPFLLPLPADPADSRRDRRTVTLNSLIPSILQRSVAAPPVAQYRNSGFTKNCRQENVGHRSSLLATYAGSLEKLAVFSSLPFILLRFNHNSYFVRSFGAGEK